MCPEKLSLSFVPEVDELWFDDERVVDDEVVSLGAAASLFPEVKL